MGSTLIFGGIDGTGVSNDEEYQETFANSHVNSLFKGWTEGPKEYYRGPSTLDWKLSALTRLQAYRIYNFVSQCWRNQGKKAVFLAGYSRGGAAVIEVAKWLKADNIPVECLILYDPVDRTGQVGLPWQDTPIVDTVRHVIYAQRSPSSKSRESFSNCGTKLEDSRKTKLSYDMFLHTTHGGMGGAPWTEPKIGFIDEGPPDGITNVTVGQDEAGANRIKKWSFDLIFDAIYECKQRLEQEDRTTPNPDFQIPNQRNAPSLGGGKPGQRIHIVVAGEWLSKIALQYYGDAMKYNVIHQANLAEIGPDPNKIKPGQRLIIP